MLVTTRERRYVSQLKKKVFKILTVESIREFWNLIVSQLGTVRIFKGFETLCLKT
jgi:hypothetical protein